MGHAGDELSLGLYPVPSDEVFRTGSPKGSGPVATGLPADGRCCVAAGRSLPCGERRYAR
jgi:hypothetical protein